MTAIDGDISINDNITYYLISDCKHIFLLFFFFHLNHHILDDFISIDKWEGIITVDGIDRDTLNQEIFFFTIVAEEQNLPNYNTTQEVTFIVDDVNDNSPIIIVPESKIFNITIPENLITDLNDPITINDRDSVSS